MSKYLKFMNTPEGVQQIFTREKIGKMSGDEFEKYEKRIHEQLNKIGIPTSGELAYENQGKIFVWHTMGDGKVCGECDSMEGKIFEHMEDIPDDLHPNCSGFCVRVELSIANELEYVRTKISDNGVKQVSRPRDSKIQDRCYVEEIDLYAA